MVLVARLWAHPRVSYLPPSAGQLRADAKGRALMYRAGPIMAWPPSWEGKGPHRFNPPTESHPCNHTTVCAPHYAPVSPNLARCAVPAHT